MATGGATATTDADGNYSLTLPADSLYDLEITKYGYLAESVTDIDLAEDEVEDVDVTLDEADEVVVSGVVTDGSGLGTPLYAEVTITAPGATISAFTDPATGQYSLEAYEGTLVKIEATAIDPGYLKKAMTSFRKYSCSRLCIRN